MHSILGSPCKRTSATGDECGRSESIPVRSRPEYPLTLRDLSREPTIYLIPECDTEADVHEVLRELCEEIFVEQLAGWFRDEETWPQDRGFDVFCRSFEFRHHSMLVDLSDEPLIDELD